MHTLGKNFTLQNEDGDHQNNIFQAMKKKIENWENRNFFEHPCLNENLDKCNPQEYFKEVSHSIDLTQIYKIIDSCYYNQEMPIYPVLVEICQEKIREFYGGFRYLLQVWNVSDSKKLVQVPLNHRIKNWAVCFDYLIYTLNEGDEDSDCLHLHNFTESEPSLIKIRNLGLSKDVTSLSYYNNTIYVAKGEVLEVHTLTEDQMSQEETIESSDLEPIVIDIGLKIHALMQINDTNALEVILLVLESHDNQLDFNQLYLGEAAATKSGNDGQEYLLVQHAQKVKRDQFKHDPIREILIRHIDSKSGSYAIAIRQSGGADIYYNMSRTSSVDNFNAISMNASFKTALIKQRTTIADFLSTQPDDYFLFPDRDVDPEDPQYIFVYYPFLLNKQMSFETSVPITNPELLKTTYRTTFEEFHLEIAAKATKFFNSMDLKGESFQAVFAHDKFLSIFDLKSYTWSNHMELEANIKSLIKFMKDDEQFCGAILDNNKIIIINFNDIEEGGLPEIQDHYTAEEDQEILDWSIDQTERTPIFLTMKNSESGLIKVHYLNNCGELYDIDHTGGEIDERCSILSIRSENNLYLVLQNKELIQLYSLVYEKDKVKKAKETKKGDDEEEEEEEEDNDYYMDKFLESITVSGLYGKVHSVCSKNPKKHLILFDEKNTYIVKFNPTQFKTFENTFVKYACNDEKMDLYFVSQEKQDCTDGPNRMMSIDVNASIKNNKPSLLPVVDNTYSSNAKIYVGLNNSRIGFFQSYNEFIITIFLNRNINAFFTKIKSYDFVVYRQIKDRVIILGVDQKLYTFDIVSGKQLFVNDSNVDLTGYTQYNPRGYQTTIFHSTEPLDKEVVHQDFYPDYQLETTTKNQMSFRATNSPSSLHLFREIEVINESQIKVHWEIEYPFLYNSGLNLSINTNKKRDHMIIRDDFGVAMFKIVYTQGYKAKLQIVRQIDEFPTRLQEYYRYRLDFFSPSFSKFINFQENAQNITFYIQDTISGQKILNIPETYMVFDKNETRYSTFKPQMLINRLQWVDDRILRIINDEGVEKLLDTEDKFKELRFNQIPLYEELCLEEWLQEYHIIISRAPNNDPVIKLKQIYQEYKSLKNLFVNTTRSEYNQLLMKQDFEDINKFNHSFTVMSWNIAWQLKQGNLKVEQLSDSNIVGLLYAVFPGGNTILHYLCENQPELEKLLEFCHPEGKSILHHIPFIENSLGETPLHICIKKKASKAVNTLLKHLSLYPADHHSKAIKNVLHTLVEMKLADFDTYMESRFQQNEQHKTFEKLHITFDSVGFTTSSPWINSHQIYRELTWPDEVERRVKVETLDIAGVYHYNDPDEDKFFDALASTDNFEYFEMKSIQTLIDFNYPIVQRFLIRKLFVPYMIFHLFYLILIFGLYESRYEEGTMIMYWIVLAINIVFATYFLINEMRQISNDGLNYLKSFWNYIDITPIFGIYAIAVFSAIDAMVHFSWNAEERVSQTIQRIVVAIVTLFMWIKFLYFFRIFDKTSYLIRAIVEVIYTMRHFFLVLLFTIVGFGNAFLVISLGNEPGSDPEKSPIFIDGYINSILFSYRMILGDFDTEAFGEIAVPLVWIMFLLFTVFNMIVMLNLLIAVISDAYAAVAEVSEQAMYQERASMIAENNYLIPDDVKKNYCEENRLILVVTDLEDEQRPTGNDAVIQKIEQVKDELAKQIAENKASSDKNHQEMFQLVDQLKRFQLQTMPSEVIKTKLYKHNLKKMTLFQVQLVDGYEEQWGCDAMERNGCKADVEDERRTDPAEKFHHCAQCGFDMCEDCFDEYGEIHYHPTELLTLEEVRNRQDGYGDGWGCDCRLFQGCSNNFDVNHKTTPFDVMYHHYSDEDCFDLCEQCAEFYRVKE